MKNDVEKSSNAEYQKKLLSIKASFIIFVISFLALSYLYGFGRGMLFSLGIFVLIILVYGVRNIIKAIERDGLKQFKSKYKSGVILFSFNVIFNIVIWSGYLFLPSHNKEMFFFRFVILSFSLMISSVWWMAYKYFSKKPFVTYALLTFLNAGICFLFVFFLTIYITFKDLFKIL